MRFLGKVYHALVYCWSGARNRFSSFFYKQLMISCGKNVRFSARTSDFTYRNISMGNDIYVGPNALFVATASRIFIGNKVLFGPGVTIIGGDHRISDIGQFMFDLKTKQPGDDLDICIQDDVWVGTNVTILKGVTIGRGAVIAAGALVNKDVPPYSIVGGMPGRVLKFRWNLEETIRHEEMLYSPADRLLVDVLRIGRNEER